jgi:hypothetical protein
MRPGDSACCFIRMRVIVLQRVQNEFHTLS